MRPECKKENVLLTCSRLLSAVFSAYHSSSLSAMPSNTVTCISKSTFTKPYYASRGLVFCFDVNPSLTITSKDLSQISQA